MLVLILRPDKQDYQGTAVTMDVARQLNVRKLLLAINKAYSSLNQEVLKQKVEEAYGAPVAGIFPPVRRGGAAGQRRGVLPPGFPITPLAGNS